LPYLDKRIISKLKIEHGLSDVSFKTWIEPLEVHKVIDDEVYILVPLKASIDYITQKYLLPFKVAQPVPILLEKEAKLAHPFVVILLPRTQSNSIPYVLPR